MIIAPWQRVVLAVDGAAIISTTSFAIWFQGQTAMAQVTAGSYSDVSFTGAELFLVGSLLAAVCSALGILFRLVIKYAESRALRAEKMVDDLIEPITQTAATVQEMAKAQAQQTALIRELIDEREQAPPSSGRRR